MNTNAFSTTATRKVLDAAQRAGGNKAAHFGVVAKAAHAENTTAVWVKGDGAAAANAKTFPLTFKYLKTLCAPDAKGVRRGDIAEFGSALRAFLSLPASKRAELLVPVDGEYQAAAKSPWQWTLKVIREAASTGNKTRAPRQAGTTAKVSVKGSRGGEAAIVSAAMTLRQAVAAIRHQFAAELSADAMELLIDLELGKL